VQLQDGSVRNGYDVKILNMTPEPRTVTLTLEGLPGGAMTVAGSSDVPAESLTIELEPDKVLPLRLYIRTDPALLASSHETFTIVAQSTDGAVRAASKAKFEAPEK
jgi:polyferredoxin